MNTALITGANRGLGKGFVEEYLDCSWKVIAGVRTESAADQLAEAFKGNPNLKIVRIDITDRTGVEAVAGELKGTPIDVLISNAAMTGGPVGSFGEFDHKRFAECCAINAGGFMNLAEPFAEHVAASEKRVIFSVSSRVGASFNYSFPEYFASKSALNQLVFQAAAALKPKGVTVVAAHPGWVQSDATDSFGKAPLQPREAAKLLKAVIDGLTIENTGFFFDPDGSVLPLITKQDEIKFYSMVRND